MILKRVYRSSFRLEFYDLLSFRRIGMCPLNRFLLRPHLIFFRPAYLSYGSFGQVAAHELTVGPSICSLVDSTNRYSQHAFDSAGRLYNQDGKLEEWWTNTTSDGFNARQKCIAEQYSSEQPPSWLMLRDADIIC